MTQELQACAVRARLMDEIASAGVRLALPIGLSEVDVLAYTAAPSGSVLFTIPIKVMSMSFEVFSNRLASLKPSGLLAVLMNHVDGTSEVKAFAFTPQELVLLQMIGIIERSSERSRNDMALKDAIKPYAMSSGTWHRKISTMIRTCGTEPAA